MTFDCLPFESCQEMEFLEIRLDLCTRWPCRLVVDRLCVMLSLGKDFRGEANKVLKSHGTRSNATLTPQRLAFGLLCGRPVQEEREPFRMAWSFSRGFRREKWALLTVGSWAP